MERSSLLPPRATVSVSGSPGRRASTFLRTCAASARGSPSIATHTSPARAPAKNAGEPGNTSTINAPVLVKPGASATSTIRTPTCACVTCCPLARSPTTLRTSLTGIAKPMPSASARTAAVMATTSPNSFTSGPPELPGLMAQSVCRKSTRRSGMPSSLDVRRRLDTMPSVMVLSRPKGLPSAITQSPTSSEALSPSGGAAGSAKKGGGDDDALFARGGSVSTKRGTRTSAMSVSASTPTTSPGTLRPSASVTRTTPRPLMTCALVTISPFSESITKPHPWPLKTAARFFSRATRRLLVAAPPEASETSRRDASNALYG